MSRQEGSKRKPGKAWKYCRQGHRLRGYNLRTAGKQHGCRKCWNAYIRKYNRGFRQNGRAPLLTCKRGHRMTPDNVLHRGHRNRICKACQLRRVLYYASHRKLSLRPLCSNGHAMVPGNRYVTKKGATKCRQCQRNFQKSFDAAHGIARRPLKQIKNEVEFWEKVLKDHNLHMSRGAWKLSYGDVPLTVAERDIVHLRYAKGHKHKRLA
jgi:hypothetical protein